MNLKEFEREAKLIKEEMNLFKKYISTLNTRVENAEIESKKLNKK